MNARAAIDWHAYEPRTKVRALELAKEDALCSVVLDLFRRGWSGEAVMLPRVKGVPGVVQWDVPFFDAVSELAAAASEEYVDMLLRAEMAPADQKEAIRAKFRAESFTRWMNYYGDDVARVMAADEVAADAYNEGGLQ